MNHEKILRRHAHFAANAIASNTPGKPFPSALSTFFKLNKNFGSKDRKRIRAMSYAWFRLGFALNGNVADQVILAYLTLEETEVEGLAQMAVDLNLPEKFMAMPMADKLAALDERGMLRREKLFPTHLVSNQLDSAALVIHQLSQPLLWLSVLKDHQEKVVSQLENEGIAVTIEESVIGVPVNTSVDAMLKPDTYEVQDLSCQLALRSLSGLEFETVWDCCAGSGGKSLTLGRENKSLRVFASDIRPQMLSNLSQRFKLHSLSFYMGRFDLNASYDQLSFVKGEGGEHLMTTESFDLVLADLPCSGSGTWNRNPEFTSHFEDIPASLLTMQQNILRHSWPFVKEGGYLLMMTCSVFEQENEAQIASFNGFAKTEVIHQGYVKGYEHRSDSIYFCLMRKG